MNHPGRGVAPAKTFALALIFRGSNAGTDPVVARTLVVLCTAATTPSVTGFSSRASIGQRPVNAVNPLIGGVEWAAAEQALP